jgi:hypothetical protein
MMMKINEGQKGVEGNYHPSRLLMPSVSAPSPKCCLHLQQQVLRCAATQLKTSHRCLQHTSNIQRMQALTRQAPRTARAAPFI